MQEESAEGRTKKSFAAALYSFLRSTKLAIFLIIALTSALLISNLIPQILYLVNPDAAVLESHHPSLFAFLKTVGLTNINSAWWFYALLVLFLLNTLFCLIERVKLVLKTQKWWMGKPSPSLKQKARLSTPVYLKTSPGKAIGRAESLLLGKRYKVIREGNQLVAGKNQWGNWGAVVLHASFLVIALGALISRSTFMNGQIDLIEGQRFFDTKAGYPYVQTGPFFGDNYTSFEVRLERFAAEFWQNGTGKERASTISIYDGGRKVLTKTVSPNYPTIYKGRTIYQFGTFGNSAILRLDKPQQPGQFGWINFEIPDDANKELIDKVVFHGTNFRADAKLYPDYGNKGVLNKRDIYRAKNPALFLKIFDRNTGKIAYDVTLKPNQSVNLGDSTLTFVEVRHWTKLGVKKDSGAWIIFLGFWMALAGIAMLYFIIPKRVWVYADEAEDGTVLYLTGSAGKYRAAFKEHLDELRNKISYNLLSEQVVLERATV